MKQQISNLKVGQSLVKSAEDLTLINKILRELGKSFGFYQFKYLDKDTISITRIK